MTEETVGQQFDNEDMAWLAEQGFAPRVNNLGMDEWAFVEFSSQGSLPTKVLFMFGGRNAAEAAANARKYVEGQQGDTGASDVVD